MHEPCKPGRKHQLDEDGTEDVMHEPGKNLTGDSSATIMNDVQVEVSE